MSVSILLRKCRAAGYLQRLPRSGGCLRMSNYFSEAPAGAAAQLSGPLALHTMAGIAVGARACALLEVPRGHSGTSGDRAVAHRDTRIARCASRVLAPILLLPYLTIDVARDAGCMPRRRRKRFVQRKASSGRDVGQAVAMRYPGNWVVTIASGCVFW